MSVSLAFGWRQLLFANWPASPDDLRPHLPVELAVDEFDGTGWVSIVPFVNVETRPRGLPAWLGIRLPELNVRTYVSYGGAPGIYFFSLDAHGLLAVVGGRLTHHLPYYYARGRFQREDGRVAVTSRRWHPGERPAAFDASYWPTGDPFVSEPGTLEAFLTERRRLYTQALDGTLRYTDVEHDRWRLYPAAATIEENTLFEANSLAPPDARPELYYSPGVDVTTTRSRRAEPNERG